MKKTGREEEYEEEEELTGERREREGWRKRQSFVFKTVRVEPCVAE